MKLARSRDSPIMMKFARFVHYTSCEFMSHRECDRADRDFVPFNHIFPYRNVTKRASSAINVGSVVQSVVRLSYFDEYARTNLFGAAIVRRVVLPDGSTKQINNRLKSTDGRMYLVVVD